MLCDWLKLPKQQNSSAEIAGAVLSCLILCITRSVLLWYKCVGSRSVLQMGVVTGLLIVDVFSVPPDHTCLLLDKALDGHMISIELNVYILFISYIRLQYFHLTGVVFFNQIAPILARP